MRRPPVPAEFRNEGPHVCRRLALMWLGVALPRVTGLGAYSARAVLTLCIPSSAQSRQPGQSRHHSLRLQTWREWREWGSRLERWRGVVTLRKFPRRPAVEAGANFDHSE